MVELLVLNQILKLSIVTLNVVLKLVFGVTGETMTHVPRLVELELKPEQEPRLLKNVVETHVMELPLKPPIVQQLLALYLVLELGPNGLPSVLVMEQD